VAINYDPTDATLLAFFRVKTKHTNMGNILSNLEAKWDSPIVRMAGQTSRCLFEGNKKVKHYPTISDL